MQAANEGTFTGFLLTLGHVDIDKFEIEINPDVIILRVRRGEKFATRHLSRDLLELTTVDAASVELGDLLNDVLR